MPHTFYTTVMKICIMFIIILFSIHSYTKIFNDKQFPLPCSTQLYTAINYTNTPFQFSENGQQPQSNSMVNTIYSNTALNMSHLSVYLT